MQYPSLFNKVAVVAVGFVLVAGAFLFGTKHVQQPQTQQQNLVGASSGFYVVEGIPYTVIKTIAPTDSTLTLSSFKTPDGRALTMSMFGAKGYATLDPNNLSRLESVSFTGITQNGDGTATLTGVSRGLDFVTPYAASTTLAQIHLVGSQLILTNTSAFYGNEFLFANQAGTSTAVLVFSSSTPPHYDLDPGASYWTTAASSTLVSLAQLQRTALAGATNASTLINGLVQIATGAQAASTTSTGSTGAILALSTQTATDTPQSKCNSSGSANGAGCTIIADLGGHLKQAWIDLTQAFTVTGNWTFNTGTVTFGNGLLSTASSTFNVGTLHIGSQTVPAPLFGGTGADGALTISSGTTTIDVGTNSYVEKNYTSISITGTGALSFTSSATSSAGVVIVLRSQGAVTLTSSAQEMINLHYLGGGNNGGDGITCSNCTGGTGGGGGASGLRGSFGQSNDGAGGAVVYLGGDGGPAYPPLTPFNRTAYPGGKGGAGTAGAGGWGAGGLYIEAAGAYNCTTGAIDASGLAGTSGSGTTGGAGGGGAGSVLVLYGSLTADSCTYNVTGGGGGGNGGGTGGTGGNGASGMHLEKLNTFFY